MLRKIWTLLTFFAAIVGISPKLPMTSHGNSRLEDRVPPWLRLAPISFHDFQQSTGHPEIGCQKVGKLQNTEIHKYRDTVMTVRSYQLESRRSTMSIQAKLLCSVKGIKLPIVWVKMFRRLLKASLLHKYWPDFDNSKCFRNLIFLGTLCKKKRKRYLLWFPR